MEDLVEKTAKVEENINNSSKKGENMEKDVKNIRKTTKNNEKGGKNIEKVDKNVVDTTVTDGVKKAREALKKKGVVKPKTKKAEKGGDIVIDKFKDYRGDAEKLLIKVCKDLKLAAPERIAVKRTSKTGLAAIRAKVGNEVKVAIRATDICIYSPPSIVKFGRGESNYPHVTIISWGDPNLEKAFHNALKDKKTSSQWASELKWVNPRTKTKVSNVETKISRLENELKRLRAMKKERSTAKPNKVAIKKVTKKTIQGVALQTA